MEKAQQFKALVAPAGSGFGSQQSKKNKQKNQLTIVYNPVPWQMVHSFDLMGTRNTCRQIYKSFLLTFWDREDGSVGELATQS